MPAPDMNQSPNVLTVSGVLDSTVALTELHLSDGRRIQLPTVLLEGETTAARFEEARDSLTLQPASAGSNTDQELVIPLIEERLDIGKRTVVTGKVRLQKTVHAFAAALDEPLAVRTYDIERVVLNQPVEVAPGVRSEGETTIYPLVEEQLILTKHLVLKEEVRVTKRDTERRDTQVVTLRREHMLVERAPVEKEPA